MAKDGMKNLYLATKGAKAGAFSVFSEKNGQHHDDGPFLDS